MGKTGNTFKLFKKIVRKLHLWLGLSSGLVVFIVSITGCIFVFSQEITHTIRKDAIHVKEESGITLPITDLWQRAENEIGPEYDITMAKIYNSPDKSWIFLSYKDNPGGITYFGMIDYYKSIYINPYNGKVTGVYDEESDFFNIVKFLHWSLLFITPIGQPIVGWSTLIFVVMLISGIILWWPKNKNAAKQRFWFRWKEKTKWKRKNYDFHNILGFYFASLALIIASTGLVWAFKWFSSLIYFAGSGTTVPPDVSLAQSTYTNHITANPLERVINKAATSYPNASIYGITLPEDSLGIINVTIQQKEDVLYVSHNMQFDQYTGKLLKERKHSEKNFGEKLINANFDIHVGAILGLPGKILAFLASLICASLPITGFMIWIGRRSPERKKISKKEPDFLYTTSVVNTVNVP